MGVISQAPELLECEMASPYLFTPVVTTCPKYSPASGNFALQLAQLVVGALDMRLNGTKSGR